MPGAHNKRKSKRPNTPHVSEEVVFRDDAQMYASVTKAQGSGRFVAVCGDGVERSCKLRGAMRKSEWVSVGTIVLVSVREYDENKADILHRYTDRGRDTLRRYGELEFLEKRKAAEEDDGGVVFVEDDDVCIDDM